MGASYDLALFAVGLCSATFFWIAAIVQIEGDHRAPITTALTTTCAALGLLALGDLSRTLFPFWALLQDRLDGWLITAITTGWYATAIYQTRALFSKERWRRARQLLWAIGVSGALVAGIGTIWPELTHVTALATAPAITAAGWLAIVQVVGALGLACGVYIRAQVLVRRTQQRYRPDGQQRHRVGRWGLPATVAALAAAATALPATHWSAAVDHAPRIFPLWTSTLALVAAATLLFSLTTNRALLGRPIHARRLAARWVLLIAFFGALALIAWLDQARMRVGLIVVSVGAPAVLATLDLRLIRFYREHVAGYRQFIEATIIDWPFAGPDSNQRRMDALFQALLGELQPDAVYLRIQAGAHEAAYERRHQWDQIPPRRPFSTRYDARPITANEQEIGVIALYGPRGIAYSQLELDIAVAYASAIASLYRATQHAQAFEALVVEDDRRRQEGLQTMHGLLHDLVVGNLDVVDKGVQLIRPRLDPHQAHLGEVLDDVEEAAREAMATTRKALLQQQRELYPTALTARGFIAALERDLLPGNWRPDELSVSIEANGLDDAELNRLLDDRLKRVLYGATQEALRNAARHAGGSIPHPLAVVVRLSRDDAGLTIAVRDNGAGFEPAAAEIEGRGMGLHYHHAAMRAVGGSLEVRSGPRQGTEVRLHIPMPALCHQLPSCPFKPDVTTIARSRVGWARVILQTERLSGGRWLVNDDLSDLTRPPAVSEWYYRLRAEEPEYSAMLQIERERQRLFAAQVETSSFREIVDRRRLERYIATGATDSGQPQLDIALAHQHVRAVIALLRTYPHYELALSDTPSETNYEIKPGHAVLWEQRAENGESTIDGFLEGIRDTDPGTVASFERRFEAAWERIPRHRRTREHVIQWLESQLQERERLQLAFWDVVPDL